MANIPPNDPNVMIPPLDDFVCFAIYSANLAFNRAYKPFLTKLGLTYTQWIVMVCLFENDHQTVSELGKKLFLASNTLTPLLKQLEKTGMVIRTRNKQDERQVIISLTETGKSLYQQACLSDKTIFNHLDNADIKALQKHIIILRDNLLKSIEHDTPVNAMVEF